MNKLHHFCKTKVTFSTSYSFSNDWTLGKLFNLPLIKIKIKLNYIYRAPYSINCPWRFTILQLLLFRLKNYIFIQQNQVPINKNYKSNMSLNRLVLSLVLNKVTDAVFLMSNGNLFHSFGSATEYALSPYVFRLIAIYKWNVQSKTAFVSRSPLNQNTGVNDWRAWSKHSSN